MKLDLANFREFTNTGKRKYINTPVHLFLLVYISHRIRKDSSSVLPHSCNIVIILVYYAGCFESRWKFVTSLMNPNMAVWFPIPLWPHPFISISYDKIHKSILTSRSYFLPTRRFVPVFHDCHACPQCYRPSHLHTSFSYDPGFASGSYHPPPNLGWTNSNPQPIDTSSTLCITLQMMQLGDSYRFLSLNVVSIIWC